MLLYHQNQSLMQTLYPPYHFYNEQKTPAHIPKVPVYMAQCLSDVFTLPDFLKVANDLDVIWSGSVGSYTI